MQPGTKKALKWTGIVLGSILLLVIATSTYIYSLIPAYEGECPPLQTYLFEKPGKDLPMEGKYIYKSATELAAMIKNHEATSYDIVKEYLANIRNNNYKYNAIVWLREEEALEEARKADEAVMRGDSLPILHGVPVTVKEMFWVKGLPNNMNAKMMGGFIAAEDGELVKQLKKSGAIILGTSNVPFMLGDFQTYGEIYPTSNNPFDTTKTPGGSSGGSAAALAAGFTPLELGSDLGGSISVPAAFCGVYGLKTTFGTLNLTEGTGPDTITKYTRFAMGVPGPMARTAEDLELMWLAMKDTKIDNRFQHNTAWQSASNKTVNQYHVAWTDDWESAKAGKDVKEKLNMLLGLLNGQGTKTVKEIPPTYGAMQNSYLRSYALMMGENQPWLMRKLISMDFGKFDDGSVDLKAFYEAIDNPTEENWNGWKSDNEKLIAIWDAFFKKNDFLICPVTFGTAFQKCELGTPIPVDGSTVAYSAYLIPYSTVFAATGHPTVTFPVGLNKEGLPIGLQIVGPYYSEPELLHFTRLLSKLLPGFVPPNQVKKNI